jgi:hypothetical protein
MGRGIEMMIEIRKAQEITSNNRDSMVRQSWGSLR